MLHNLRRLVGSLVLLFRHKRRAGVPASDAAPGERSGAWGEGDIETEVLQNHQEFVDGHGLLAKDHRETLEGASQPSGPQETVSAPATVTLAAIDPSHQNARTLFPAPSLDPPPLEIRGDPHPIPFIPTGTSPLRLSHGRSHSLPVKATRFSANTERRRALLVACTYQKSGAGDGMQLGTTWKDVINMKRLLIASGWQANEITILCDADYNADDKKEIWPHPTRENIIKQLRQLAEWARAGDLVVFLFSGHGGQKEAESDTFEVDGKDEYILPCDFYELQENKEPWYILDDELRRILVDPLILGTRLIAICDACSSGTILDLPVEAITKHPTPHDDRIIHGLVICISACCDSATSYQTRRGGILVYYFCEVMTAALETPEKAITISELETALKARILPAFNEAKENGGWGDEWMAPIPYFSFSRRMDYDNTLLNLA